MLRLISELMGFYRDLLVVKTGGTAEDLSTADDLEHLKQLAGSMSFGQLTYSLTLLSQLASFPGNNPRMQLELTLIKLCKPELDGSAEALIRRVERLEQGASVCAVSAAASSSAPVSKPKPSKTALQQGTAAASGVASPAVAESSGQEQNFDLWPEVLEKLKGLNGPLFGALASSQAYVQGERVLIDCENPLFLELVRTSEQAKTSLRKAIELVTGKVYGLSPYKRAQQKRSRPDSDPLDAFAQKAEEIGVDIKVE